MKSPLEVVGQRFPRAYKRTVIVEGVETIYEFTPRWNTKRSFQTAMLHIYTAEQHPRDISPAQRHEPAHECLVGSVAQQVWALVQAAYEEEVVTR